MEILSEGIGSSPKPSRKKKPSRTNLNEAQKTYPRSKVYDSIHFAEGVKNSVNVLTGDPMMASIFEDTAIGTLQEQLNVESTHGAHSDVHVDPTAQAMSESDPLDLFGDVSKNWATLAFNDKKPV